MRETRAHKLGMTLIEILVVVSVFAIIAGVLTPALFKQIERGKTARVKQDMDVFKGALVEYFEDTGHWPCGWDARTSQNAHTALASFSCFYAPDGTSGWDGPYLDQSASGNNVAQQVQGGWTGVIDPWKHPYRILQANVNTQGAPYGTIVVYCTGKDGSVNTNDANLLAGIASGDDVVLIVTRRAAG